MSNSQLTYKPIFLQATDYFGSAALSALENQTILKDSGEEEPIEVALEVTPLDPRMVYNIGEIYATDSLHLNKRGNYYTAGAKMYKLTDSNRMILVEDFRDSEHRTLCMLYSKFLNGSSPAQPSLKIRRKPKNFMQKLRADITKTPPTIEDDGFYIDEGLWYYMIRNYIRKESVLITGPSGAGKTDAVHHMMKKLGKPLDVFDMAVSNPYKTFCGNLRAENGSTYFQKARFATTITTEGCGLMDELTRAVPSANNIFLPLLDKRKTLYIEDATLEADREIKMHEKRVLWATANIGAEYTGTNNLDHALLNRFQQVGMYYPPQEKESLLLQKLFELSKVVSDRLTGIANDVRKNDTLSKDISTRQLFKIASLMADGMSMIDSFTWTVLQQFDGGEGLGGERQTVSAILDRFS